jgi:hypothetical protein
MVEDDQDAWTRARRTYHRALQGRGIVALGVVAAVIFPLVGVMIGTILIFKSRIGPGLGCILVGVVAGVAYYLLGDVGAVAWAPPYADLRVACSGGILSWASALSRRATALHNSRSLGPMTTARL